MRKSADSGPRAIHRRTILTVRPIGGYTQPGPVDGTDGGNFWLRAPLAFETMLGTTLRGFERMVERVEGTGQGSRQRRVALVCAVFLLLPACSSAPDSPEAQIRALIARAETAAEEKDLGALKGMISDDYSDRQGQNKQMIVRVVGYHLMRSKTIHLLTQIAKIDLQDTEHAEVRIFLAMAGRAIDGFDQVSRLRADLYRLDFSVVAEQPKDWKVTRAEWRPAEMEDLGG